MADSATAIVTNNRGPSDVLVLDGRRCAYWASWAPQRASIGLCVTLFTYANDFRCSVSADASCVPEPQMMVDLIMDELEALIDLTSAPEQASNAL